LTEAIAKNPFLKEAYLERAASYYELGEFDKAIEDYAMQEMSPRDVDSSEFAKGFMGGAVLGCADAVIEFIPNTISCLQGLGHFLWSAVQHPIEAPREVIIHVLEICSILKECSPYELSQIAIPELGDLMAEWDEIEDQERGQKMGHLLGKFGTELLSPLAIKKGAGLFNRLKDLKKAEKLVALECLSDASTNEKMVEAATKWAKGRNEKLSKIKLEVDKQNKHVVGAHNYEDSKSIFNHPDAQGLLDKFAGKGRKVGHVQGSPGTAGYKEKVNFGEVIGKVKNGDDPENFLETTWGMIHYSKNGAHIVPNSPDKF
jgi:hypothetical protein